MAEAIAEVQPVPEAAQAPERKREDLFKGVRPYYGSVVQFEKRDNVPTLFTICVRCVLDKEINFEGVPTVLCSKLAQYKLHQDYNGPKVFKCSVCSKFYTKQKKFDEHSCD